MKQNDSKCYYYITNYEVFPGYTRDLLRTNFLNATANKYTSEEIIPNIYIGGEEINTKDNKIELLFNGNSETNNRFYRSNDRKPKSYDNKYLIFEKDRNKG